MTRCIVLADGAWSSNIVAAFVCVCGGFFIPACAQLPFLLIWARRRVFRCRYLSLRAFVSGLRNDALRIESKDGLLMPSYECL